MPRDWDLHCGGSVSLHCSCSSWPLRAGSGLRGGAQGVADSRDRRGAWHSSWNLENARNV